MTMTGPGFDSLGSENHVCFTEEMKTVHFLMLCQKKRIYEVIYKHFDLPLSGVSTSTSSSGVSLAFANPVLFSMGSATLQLSSNCWLSLESLAA